MGKKKDEEDKEEQESEELENQVKNTEKLKMEEKKRKLIILSLARSVFTPLFSNANENRIILYTNINEMMKKDGNFADFLDGHLKYIACPKGKFFLKEKNYKEYRDILSLISSISFARKDHAKKFNDLCLLSLKPHIVDMKKKYLEILLKK